MDNLTNGDRRTVTVVVRLLCDETLLDETRRDVRLLDETYGCCEICTVAGRDMRLLEVTFGCRRRCTAVGEMYGCCARHTAIG